MNTSRTSCGTLNYNKGIVELLWAWPEVLRQVRSAQLHVFGKFGQWIDPQGTKFNGFDKILAANELVFAECIDRFIKAGGDPSMVCGKKNRNASE